jgi:imidazolonepropionase
MKFVVSLACIKMRLQPAEALNAATLNSAYAMGLSHTHGSIAVGKVANCFVTEPIPSLDYIPYAYTQPVIRRVFLRAHPAGHIHTGAFGEEVQVADPFSLPGGNVVPGLITIF